LESLYQPSPLRIVRTGISKKVSKEGLASNNEGVVEESTPRNGGGSCGVRHESVLNHIVRRFILCQAWCVTYRGQAIGIPAENSITLNNRAVTSTGVTGQDTMSSNRSIALLLINNTSLLHTASTKEKERRGGIRKRQGLLVKRWGGHQHLIKHEGERERGKGRWKRSPSGRRSRSGTRCSLATGSPGYSSTSCWNARPTSCRGAHRGRCPPLVSRFGLPTPCQAIDSQ
jgi:hypothetical protein